jgi:hypothetical protein
MTLPHKLTATLLGAAMLGGSVADATIPISRPASPSPCAADGSCSPQQIWGYSQQRWRRWPGDYDTGKPTEPTQAEGEDSLLKGIDPPGMEEEDAQAPPSIEESEEAREEGAKDLNLPPLPAPAAPPAMGAPAMNAPAPAAPGMRAPGQAAPNAAPAENALPGLPGLPSPPFRGITPPAPAPGAQVLPPANSTPRIGSRTTEDAPPQMPLGFTQLAPQVDHRVQPATSTVPAAGLQQSVYHSDIRSLPPIDELP